MSGLLWNLVAFVLALGLLITVHEFGHFWVARKNGVLVKKFSIGFGKTLFSWRDKQGTEFVIAAIPLGGYVRMLDERVDPVLPQFADLAFNNKTVPQRMAVIAAGPMANFLFAIFVLALMYLVGVPTLKPVVGSVTENSIAARADLPVDHQIVAVNGDEVRDWQAISLMLVGQIGQDAVVLTLQTPESSRLREVRLDLSEWKFDPDKESLFTSLGFAPKQASPLLVVNTLEPGSAAEMAGLKPQDKFVSAAGVTLKDWAQLVSIIQNNPGIELPFVIERGGVTQQLSITPQSRLMPDGFHQGFLGVSPVVQQLDDSMYFEQRYGPVDAVWQGMLKTWQLVKLTLSMLEKFVFGDVSVKHLGGPISMAQGAGMSAELGLIAFLSFLALISVNLGVVNLLPLPILDGGHLMYLVVELLTGRPVSEKAQEAGFKIGAFVLLMLMGIALLNDISRL